ncbi:MAG: site-specific integrase [Syntrophobacteraceae bacterium]|nr:site-specific integrase [Syntrophobacteraceae bacterium]
MTIPAVAIESGRVSSPISVAPSNEVAQGKTPNLEAKRVRFDDLAADLLSDYCINERKSLERAEISVKHLNGLFGGKRALDITTSKIREYVEARLQDSAAKATINRELAALKRMLNPGSQCTPPKIDRVPHIPMLKENNPRKGFFEHADFLSVRDALPFHLGALVTFAYKTGWRKEGVMDLQWTEVDQVRGIVRLNPGETKKNEGRAVYLDEELKDIFRTQWAQRKVSETLSPYVFPNETGTDRIKSFRGSWDAACKAAQVPGRLFHDLRRTAVRNMVRAGIPERVAMTISGHKTRSIFDRYNIVSESDLELAAARQEAYLNSAVGTKTGTVTPIKKRA